MGGQCLCGSLLAASEVKKLLLLCIARNLKVKRNRVNRLGTQVVRVDFVIELDLDYVMSLTFAFIFRNGILLV